MSSSTMWLVERHKRRCEQSSILRKLETLWAASPDRQLADLLDSAITEHSPRDCGISACTTDEVVGVALDGALAAAGLTETGGWKS